MFRMTDLHGGGAFVLSHAAVADLVREVSLRDFSLELVSAIEATYGDRYLKAIKRTGWTQDRDTLEVMGCQSVDYTCVKVISSNPSIASAEIPAVTGTLVCTDVGADQACLVCDTAILTPVRTAASTAVVLKRLKPHPKSVGIVGAGLEGTAHAVVLALLFHDVSRIAIYDSDGARGEAAIQEILQLLRSENAGHIEVAQRSQDELSDVLSCDVIVTATYGWESIRELADGIGAKARTFIAAVGADLERKKELDEALYHRARFIADDLAQCLHQGELQHAAPELGVTKREIEQQTSHGGDLLDGRIIGVEDLLARTRGAVKRSEPITIYDSTGFSGQDLAVARVMLKLCEARGVQRVPWNPSKAAYLSSLLTETRDAEAVRR
jgi:ornithine cyclodeaminase